jgi:protein-tyrosine-phosphatase
MMARIQALRQVEVASAGTSATDGTPASGNALKVMRESGLDLGGHRSRLATPAVIEAADLVLTMTAAHAAMIARTCPVAARRVVSLGTFTGDGADVPDPHGDDLDEYRRCADQIRLLVGVAVSRLAENFEPHTFDAVACDSAGTLFRVARPGRGCCGAEDVVPEEAVRAWVNVVHRRLAGAPAGAKELTVDYVCLLGAKADGRDEIGDFYVGCAAGYETGSQFQALLNRLGSGRISFRVHRFPTTDHAPVPEAIQAQVLARVRGLLAERRTVLVGCSAGRGRTNQVLLQLSSREHIRG